MLAKIYSFMLLNFLMLYHINALSHQHFWSKHVNISFRRSFSGKDVIVAGIMRWKCRTLRYRTPKLAENQSLRFHIFLRFFIKSVMVLHVQCFHICFQNYLITQCGALSIKIRPHVIGGGLYAAQRESHSRYKLPALQFSLCSSVAIFVALCYF